MAEATVTQLEPARVSAPAAAASAYDAAVAKYRAITADQAKKKEALKARAEQDQVNQDALNCRDDQFDLSDAAGHRHRTVGRHRADWAVAAVLGRAGADLPRPADGRGRPGVAAHPSRCPCEVAVLKRPRPCRSF